MSHTAIPSPLNSAFDLAFKEQDLNAMQLFLETHSFSPSLMHHYLRLSCHFTGGRCLNDKDLEIAKLLIAHGAEVDHRGPVCDRTILMEMVFTPFRENGRFFHLLLSNGADINLQDTEGCSVMDRAIWKDIFDPDQFNFLIKHGAKSTAHPETPLIEIACSNGKICSAINLVKCGVDFKKHEKFLVNSLGSMLPIRNYMPAPIFEMVCALIEYGTPLNSVYTDPRGSDKTLADRIKELYGKDKLETLIEVATWARRKDLLETLVNASQAYFGAGNEVSIPYGPLLGEKAAEDSAVDAQPSVLATIFRDTRMLGHDGHRYVAEYGGMTAMFL